MRDDGLRNLLMPGLLAVEQRCGVKLPGNDLRVDREGLHLVFDGGGEKRIATRDEVDSGAFKNTFSSRMAAALNEVRS